MANEIFISYKREDLEKVKAIKTELDEVLRGEHCWIDLDGIESGNRAFQVKINKAIEESTVFLFMMSKSSVVSDNCLQELMKADQEYAKDEKKHLVLVKIDPGYEMIGMFKMMFGNRDIINYDDQNQHDKLIRDLRKWLDIPEIDPLKEVRERVEQLKAEDKISANRRERIDSEMRKMQKQLGETSFECPVCGEKNQVDEQYCQRCGYILNYFSKPSFEEKRLNLLRFNWNSKLDLAAKLQQLEEEIKQSSEREQSLNSELQTSQSEYAALKRQYDEEKKYIEEAKKKEKEEEAKRLAAEEEKRKAFREFTVNGVTFKMIRVEGGSFQMGATSEQGSDAEGNEKPVHSVTLSDYMIGEMEVPQQLWKAVMGSNPSKFQGTNNPVEQVSWNDCKKFIGKLNSLTGQNFRLPTEAEWEFAARGGNKSQHYKYSGSNEIDKVAWYHSNSDYKTHPVGSKEANELGLYDMSGNVCEWCEDWFGDYSSSPQTNPNGPDKGSYRVYRGGGWFDSAGNCRVSARGYDAPDSRDDVLGLRLAL